VAQFASTASVEGIHIRANKRNSTGKGFQVRASTYSSDWLRKYRESNYALIDPVLAHARHGVGPREFKQLTFNKGWDDLTRRFLNDAKQVGLDAGVTVPLRAADIFGFVNLHFESDRSDNSQSFEKLLLFANNFCEALDRSFPEQNDYRAYELLTLRERQVLYWARTGKTSWEISIILGITERTVVAHISKSTVKLSCVNRAQMFGQIGAFIESDPVLDDFRIEL